MSNAFSHWTQLDVERHNANVRKENVTPCANPVPDGQEGSLHDDIVDHCRSKGWIALHGSMARRTARIEGEWDFIILADCGRTFFIECKTARTVQNQTQLALHMLARKLGHQPRVVRSFDEFLGIVNGPGAPYEVPDPYEVLTRK